jgi:hypothetical protein
MKNGTVTNLANGKKINYLGRVIDNFEMAPEPYSILNIIPTKLNSIMKRRKLRTLVLNWIFFSGNNILALSLPK